MRRLLLLLVVSCLALWAVGPSAPTAATAASPAVVVVPDVSPRPYVLEDVGVPRPVGNVVASADHVWAMSREDPLSPVPFARHIDPTLKAVTAQFAQPGPASAAALDGSTFWLQGMDANYHSVLAHY